jgi:uncharacterized protein (UPF0332 family)
MDGKDFIQVAKDLIKGASEAHWRSSISRSYYAAFHISRRFVLRKGGGVPQTRDAHMMVREYLIGSNDPEVSALGTILGDLHAKRRKADYDLESFRVSSNDATMQMLQANTFINDLSKK